MKHALTLLSWGFFLFWIGACATPSPSKEEAVNSIVPTDSFSKSDVEPEARLNFMAAEKSFHAGNYDAAIRIYQKIRQNHSGTRAAQLAAYRLGAIYYHQAQYKSAAKEFEYYLKTATPGPLHFDVNYNLAASYYQLGHYSESYKLLTSISGPAIQKQKLNRAEMVYELLTQTAQTAGYKDAVIFALAGHLSLPIAPDKRTELEQSLDNQLDEMENPEQLKELVEKIKDPSMRAKIGDRLRRLATPEPDTLPKFIPQTTEGDEVAFQRVNASTNGIPGRVGIILPLTGKWAPFGKRALDSIFLAANIFNNSGTKLQFFIKDTASSPINAETAVDDLVNNEGVVAILGPISWKEAYAVGKRSQELGVPNLSLAFKEGISSKGSFLFQNALTPRVQLESLVRYCIEKRGFKRFGIFAPNDSYGQDMVNHFWDLVENSGGKIVNYEVYSSKDTDFQAPIRKLAGIDPPKLRKFESEKLTEFQEKQKLAGIKKIPTALPPLINFDALFVPDSPKALGQIAPSLAYLDVDGFPLLGTAEWNTRELYQRAGKHVEGSLFPGGLNPSTEHPNQKRFIQTFADSYGETPDLLATQSYEAMLILGQALSRVNSGDREEIANSLKSLPEMESPLGKVAFDEQRLARRTLPVFTVRAGGRIVEN